MNTNNENHDNENTNVMQCNVLKEINKYKIIVHKNLLICDCNLFIHFTFERY